jgi:osmotically-inducible protein OsmY
VIHMNKILQGPLGKLTAALVLAGVCAGCAPLLLGGAVIGGGLMVTDRRTTGIQVEDEGIELRAASRVRGLATLGQVSVTSYNRTVLLTGEVPGEAEKTAVAQAVRQVENVREVVNELVVAPTARWARVPTTPCWRPRSRPPLWTPRTCRPMPSRWWPSAA